MPRILRSPESKSFSLENVSVPNADGARCERHRSVTVQRLPTRHPISQKSASSRVASLKIAISSASRAGVA